MKILIGHTNMDLDCFGSIVMARYLFPDHIPVRSRLIHPVARNLLNLYQNHLNFMPSRELRDASVSEIIIFDTRTHAKVREYFEYLEPYSGKVDVYDHHRGDSSDIPSAVMHQADYASNTTFITLMVMEKNIKVGPEDATIALTGIYADTGNFTHSNVSKADFEAAAFLLRCGADIKIVDNFLKTLRTEYHLTLFHQVLNRLVYKNINGHFIVLCYMELENQETGLSSIVEKVFEVESPDALFIVFGLKKSHKTLIIARSQKDSIDLPDILKPFGGGGHGNAASAQIKEYRGRCLLDELEDSIKIHITPAKLAEQIMSKNVKTISDEMTIMEASIALELVMHTGAPVVDANNNLRGLLTLRNISKARKAENMMAPVTAYMTVKVYFCAPYSPIREVEKIITNNNVGHIPVVSDGKVVGMITRSDYLVHIKGDERQKKNFPIPS